MGALVQFLELCIYLGESVTVISQPSTLIRLGLSSEYKYAICTAIT